MKSIRLAILGLAIVLTPAWGQVRRLQDVDQHDPTYRTISERLRTVRVSLDFTDSPLEDVIQFLRSVINVNLLVDPEVFKKHNRDELKVTLQVKDLAAENALNLILSFHKLSRQYRDGVLLITLQERLDETVYLAVYDVRDLAFVIRDFPGPKIALNAPQGQQGVGTQFTESTEKEKSELSDPQRLMELIKTNSAGKSWETNPKCSISMIGGLLVVNQTRSGQAEVSRLLWLLRMSR